MPTLKNSLSLSYSLSLSLTHTHTVLKLLKMATGMRALLDTVVQALPQVQTDTNSTLPERDRVDQSQSISRVAGQPLKYTHPTPHTPYPPFFLCTVGL